MHFRGLVLLAMLAPAAARRSLRAADYHQDAQQQGSVLTNEVESSAEARDAFHPGWRSSGTRHGKGTAHAASGPEAHRLAPPVMQVTRRAALEAGVVAALLGAARPASAGYVTSLGIETMQPKDAELDDDLLKTKKVQDAIQAVKRYKAAALELKAAFQKETNMQLIPIIRKAFDFANVRIDINNAAVVFDDQTQLTIDRIERNILYDITELENASRFKKGEEQVRTPKKIANVEKWFGKLDTDLGGFLAYFPVKLPEVYVPPPPPPPPAPEPAAEPAAAPAAAPEAS